MKHLLDGKKKFEEKNAQRIEKQRLDIYNKKLMLKLYNDLTYCIKFSDC